jgi:hypothetical protein
MTRIDEEPREDQCPFLCCVDGTSVEGICGVIETARLLLLDLKDLNVAELVSRAHEAAPNCRMLFGQPCTAHLTDNPAVRLDIVPAGNCHTLCEVIVRV